MESKNNISITASDENGLGYRSPNHFQQYQGSTSPANGPGRSVRAYDEQIDALRKENFNLRLRLYFLEESIPKYTEQANAQNGKDALLKQIIDLKVELEIARKECQTKQELLKDAAQALTEVDNMRTEAEVKANKMIGELKEKVRQLELEQELSNSQQNHFLTNIGGGDAPAANNVDATQIILEKDDRIKKTEAKLLDFQQQITKLDEILTQRDITISEYEEKVKELACQNSELAEILESKEKEIDNSESIIRDLRIENSDLKEENQKLSRTLSSVQENFHKEMEKIKRYDKEVRVQQEALAKMQSALLVKNSNTTRLLERIQEYEKMVTKLNFERSLNQRENRFFRTIISKLQRDKTECYTIEKQIYQSFGDGYEDKLLNLNKDYSPMLDTKTPNVLKNQKCSEQKLFELNNGYAPIYDTKSQTDSLGEYKLKQKMSLNIYDNTGKFTKTTKTTTTTTASKNPNKTLDICASTKSVDGYYLRNNAFYLDNTGNDTHIPLCRRHSNNSLLNPSRSNSCSSLNPNLSSSSILDTTGRNGMLPTEIITKEEETKLFSSPDGIRFIFQKLTQTGNT